MRYHTPDRLYELLPQHIRAKDVEQGYPLRALLRVIARQVDVVEENITQLHDNWFIETCEDWVVPYIGELIGYEPIETIDDPGISRSPGRDRILIPRREVANTLRYRARKGTLSVLEDLAMDITGWAAAAVEFFNKKPVEQQYANEVMLAVGGKFFDASANKLPSTKTSVALFVWRKRCYPFTLSTPNYVETQQAEFYSFSPLGNSVPLYTQYQRHNGPPNRRNLPIPVTRELFEAHPAHYYGEGKSFCIYAPEWPPVPSTGKHGAPAQPLEWKPIPSEYIIPGDLAELRKGNRPHFPGVGDNQIMVDPELGYFSVPASPSQRPNRELRVTYFSGFNANIGGGEYQRSLSAHPEARLIRIPCAGLKEALEEAAQEMENGANHILIEIIDSGLYRGWLPKIVLEPGQTLQIRAANRCRPVVWIVKRSTALPGGIWVLSYPTSCFIIDGILIAGRGLHIDEPVTKIYVREQKSARVIIRHSTLVPGWLLLPETEPVKSEGASIELNNVFVTLLIQRSIVGSISVAQEDAPQVDPSEIIIEDSILDSTAAEEPALYGESVQPAYVALTVRRSTMLGEVEVRELPLAENSIFRDKLTVHNRQGGIMRYCFAKNDSDTPRCFPRCFQCQIGADLPGCVFVGDRYGTSDYCRLKDTRTDQSSPHSVLNGGEYGGEMGVYYHLFDPVRTNNLKKRLEEYLPLGVDTKVFFVRQSC